MSESSRNQARALAQKALHSEQPLAWFEEFYQQANHDPTSIPWADLCANPHLISWLQKRGDLAPGQEALVVGSGLGDDAEELAERGWSTTAFDLSQTAIAWSQKRFPQSSVHYQQADILSLPESWSGKFDLVVEIYTLQVLPAQLRPHAFAQLARCVADKGELLIVCRGREEDDEVNDVPWPLAPSEFSILEDAGLKRVAWEDFNDGETPPVRRFRALYRRDDTTT